MYSIINSKNRMLIRFSVLALLIVVSFNNTPLVCFASDNVPIENESLIDSKFQTEINTSINSDNSEDEDDSENLTSEVMEREATALDSLETNVANDEVLSDDTLQVDDTTVESELSEELLTNINDVLTYILGILIFFVVVLLCKYSYRFFNIFF